MSNSFYWYRTDKIHSFIHMLKGFCAASVEEKDNGKCVFNGTAYDTLKAAKKEAERLAYEQEARCTR